MTLATDISSMYNHTKEVYDSLETLGATIPENKNLENLATAFDSLPTTPPYDPANPTLDGLKAALDAGDYAAFPVGTEIPDVYNNSTAFNWIVAHYGIAEKEDGNEVSGAVLIPDRNIVGSGTWGSTGRYYISSGVREKIIAGGYSDSITSKAIPIKVLYLTRDYSDASEFVYDKFFALSVKEVMGGNSHSRSVVGEGLQYFNEITSGAYSDNAYAGRNLYGVAWLRDGYASSSSYIIYTGGTISHSSTESSRNLTVGCFIPSKLSMPTSLDSDNNSTVL